MAKVDLGTKRVCPECEAKFYDLGKNPATCPMCQHSFDPSELEETAILPVGQLKPQANMEDDEDENETVEVDEDDIDEEAVAKELELDGDDAALISGGADDEEERPDFDGFSTDEDEDQDAALVTDEDDLTAAPDLGEPDAAVEI